MGGEFTSCWQGVDISGAGVFSLIFCAVSILFYSIAVGTDFWATANSNLNAGILSDVNMGLWKYCARTCSKCWFSSLNIFQCFFSDIFGFLPLSYSYSDFDNQFNNKESNLGLVQRTQATAAFCIIGAILSLFAIVCIVFSLGRP